MIFTFFLDYQKPNQIKNCSNSILMKFSCSLLGGKDQCWPISNNNNDPNLGKAFVTNGVDRFVLLLAALYAGLFAPKIT